MGEIVTVNFRGDELYGFKRDDGAFIAVKPMCDAMQLPWEPQRKRIHRDPVLSKATSIMEVPFGGHGGQEVTCLKLERVSFFLAGVDTGRIKDEDVRQRVILYQEECADVLSAHFLGKRDTGRSIGLAVGDEDEPVKARSFAERLSQVREVRQTFSQQAAREMYFLLGLEIVPTMLQPTQGQLFTYEAVRRDNAA